MNLDNVIKLFESIGIMMVIDENNKMAFYDVETQEKMECFYTKSPLALLSNDEIDYDVSLDKLIKGGRVSATSKQRTIKFGLTVPSINSQRTNDVIISKMLFANTENGIVTNGCYTEFKSGRDPYVSVTTVDVNKNVYSTTMFSSGDVELKRNEEVGYFNDTFEEGYDLSKDDMINVLNNTYLLSNISNYYSPLFPKMKNSIDKAKHSRSL